MAKIGWIDFSTADRTKMRQALSAIRPEGQLDELGIGRIRDGLADLLFPGISTIQTRAKYFFIVPYILRDFLYMKGNEKAKTNAGNYLLEREHEIKNKLRGKYSGESNTGVIGITLKDKEYIVRQPSEIYWVGLRSFGCIDTGGLALAGYLKNLNQQNTTLNGRSKEEEEDDDRDAGIDSYNTIKVPAVDSDWREEIDIKLTAKEAEFLKAACNNPSNFKQKDTILQGVFKNPDLLQCLNTSNRFYEFAQTALALPSVSSHIKKNLTLAHDFALVAEGAHILYNHILQSHFFSAQYEDNYLDEWQEWHKSLMKNMLDFDGFHIAELSDWMSEARFFVSKWWEFVRERKPYSEKSIVPLLQLIKGRELQTKKKKARLQNTLQTNHDLKAGKWIGLKPLEYRFANAKRIVQDILNPIDHA